MEHCISALREYQEEIRLRVYVTDALQAITENTTQIYTLKGLVNVGCKMKDRFADGLPKMWGVGRRKTPVKEPESKEVVVSRIMEGLKRMGK